jgi:urease accessory protein
MKFIAQLHSSRGRTAGAGLSRRCIVLLGMVLPGLAAAHDGAGLLHTHSWSLQAGWLHPFSGLDHLLAMVALGLLAAQGGKRRGWTLPIVFLVCLAAGGVAGMLGARLPGVEFMVVASLLVFGAFIASPSRLRGSPLAAVVACFAVYHGLAHGSELPVGSESVSFVVGFLLASAVLHLSGMAMAAVLRHAGTARAFQVAGAGIAATGLVLLVSQVA